MIDFGCVTSLLIAQVIFVIGNTFVLTIYYQLKGYYQLDQLEIELLYFSLNEISFKDSITETIRCKISDQ